MAQDKRKQQVSKATTPAVSPKKPAAFQQSKEVQVKYPLLWLALAVLAVYLVTISFDFTELDDTIFIRDFHVYNEDLRNFFVAFTRGLFDATKDPYYRPLFADVMQLNYQVSKQSIAGYHLWNILIHMGVVMILYSLFKKLKIKPLHAFILTLIFAVHPVLTQAVTWIPGRNDTLLALFTLPFLINVINYAESGKVTSLLFSVLFLLCAFFTKETAVFAAPVALVLLVVWMGHKWLSQRNLVLYSTWVACFVMWYIARAHATVQPTHINIGQELTDFLHKLPLIWQYTGKIFLPVNLSVFPMQRDTSDIPGLAAVALLVAGIYFSEHVQWRNVLAGAAVFLLFLLPALLVPNNLNDQSFEHRLYLPVIGMLLLLPQTVVFTKVTDKAVRLWGLAVCAVLAIINVFIHQPNFKDAYSFWSQAAKTSPHSAYALTMLGAREGDDLPKSFALFRKAYTLDPKQKYLNFYYGKMLQMQDSVLASESHLLAEKKISGYYEVDFYLAGVEMMKGDTVGAINSLRTFLKVDSLSTNGNGNLLLLYINHRQMDDAKAQALHMRAMGLQVPPKILQVLGLK